MEEFWILILVAFFATNSLDKAESIKVKLELKTFDEIFGEGWWDKGEAEDLKTPAPTNFGQNVHNQIDRQNTQIGQIEPNSTNQNPPLTESDHSGQIEPNSTDQNLPLTSRKVFNKNERKNLIEKFDQMKVELKRAGRKNSYKNELNKTVAKELGISDRTIYAWKQKLGQTAINHIYSDSEQNELMKRYYEIKDQSPNIRDKDIAKMLKIGSATLIRWKRQFKRLHPNSVDSVEENAAANIQEIGNSNSEI
uniref:Transposase n=1 Tax=Globodera rostochiensis TaxID=31243 RepID=A0A914HSP0_GLORO